MSKFNYPTRESNPFKFYLMKADFFSENISFNFNESKRLNSSFGVFLTILVITMSIILCIMFGKDVYQRNNPTLAESTLFLEDSKISKDHILFFFNFRRADGTIQEDLHKYINLKLLSMNLQNSQVVGYKYIPIKIEHCSDYHFQNFSTIFLENNINVEEYLNFFDCVSLPDDFEVYNPYGYSNSTLNIFRFVYCDHETSECPDDLDSFKEQRYIDFKFLDNYVDSYNHRKTINFFINSLSIQLTDKFSKRTFLSFKNNVYSSDEGWLFEATKETNFVTFNEKETDISPFMDNTLYELFLVSPQTSVHYKRSYLKVQDLLAKVGGFINGLIIVLKILTIDYFEFSYLLLINSLIYNEKYDDLNNDNNISIKDNNNNIKDISLSIAKDKPDFKKLIKKAIKVNNFITKINNHEKNNNELIRDNKITKDTLNNNLATKKDDKSINMSRNTNNNIESSNCPIIADNDNKKLISIYEIANVDNKKKISSPNNCRRTKSNDFKFNSPSRFKEKIKKTENNELEREDENNIQDIVNRNHTNDLYQNYYHQINKKLNSNRIQSSLELFKKFDYKYYEEIRQLDIDFSIWSYIKYRLSYIICFQKCKSPRKKIVNSIKDHMFDFFSIQREIKSKLY